MKGSERLRQIELVRRDLGHLLYHWTRRRAGTAGRDLIWKILAQQALLGAPPSAEVRDACICFSEAPITEAAALFKLRQHSAETSRYEPYGIAVRKRWLFERGGRPVIYQPLSELPSLPESMRWRHCTYDPSNDRDYAWEREWRIQTDRLDLNDPRGCLVIVPTAEEAFDIMRSEEQSTDGPAWLTTSLDFFGLEDDVVGTTV